jgi:hypothetical protein
MLAKQNAWQKVFKPKKPKWPDPQISVGQFYRTMGDQSCWEATGLAREVFSRIALEIREYLEKYSDPVSDEVTWTMYMIGRTKEASEPMIMFCGRDIKCRKYVKKTVKESGILERYPGVKLGDALRPPDFDQLVQLAGLSYRDIDDIDEWLAHSHSDDVELSQDLYMNRVAFGSKSEHTSGKKLTIPFYDSNRNLVSIRHATGGGIVHAANRYFYLTAGHAFVEGIDSSPPRESAGADDYEFDLSEADDSDDDKSLMDTTSRRSMTPDIDDSITSDDSTPSGNVQSNSAELAHELGLVPSLLEGRLPPFTSRSSIEKLEQSLDGLVAIGKLLQQPSTAAGKSELDYSLIEIFSHVMTPLLEDDTPQKLALSGNLMTKLADTTVTSITASAGIIRGMLSGTPTYQIVAGSQSTRELWTVRFSGTLSAGDCGSWVVDEESGDLIGHIVAGSPPSGVAYIGPACNVFADAKMKFHLEFKPLSNPSSDWRSRQGALSLDLATTPQIHKSKSLHSTKQLLVSGRLVT